MLSTGQGSPPPARLGRRHGRERREEPEERPEAAAVHLVLAQDVRLHEPRVDGED